MPKPDREPLALATRQTLVAAGDLASALSSDPQERMPAVLATSRMVAFMELAAARTLAPLLEEDELSVGVSIDVTHTAATPPGSELRATARFLGMEGRFYRFEVIAEDESGVVGRGFHNRAIVARERLLAGAARRVTGSRA